MAKGTLNYNKVLEFNRHIKQENIGELSDGIKKKGIRAAIFQRQQDKTDWFKYDVELPRYRVNNQGRTGRCWIYAALNTISPSIIEEHQLKDILFSQNYIAFYDLLEKANYFLETILETLEEDIDSRLLNLKLLHPIQDAGQWFFFQNIIEKYGIVTKEVMPDNIHSQDTSELISVLSDMLRENASVIRSEHKQSVGIEKLRIKKEKMLYAVYRMLSISLGEPPERFETSLELRDGTIIREKNITPMEFYRKYIHENYNENYCMIVNIPTENKPYHENYKVSYLGNVWGTKTIPYLNLPMQYLKELVQKQLEEGMPVWVGCDSRVYGDRENGIYSLDNFDLKELGFQNNMLNKKENIQYGLSYLTHAMVIKGFSSSKEGRIDKWLLENSYGEEVGYKGYFAVSDQWFDLFVYEVVIHKKFLSHTIKACYKKGSITLQPWDILGTLAK